MLPAALAALRERLVGEQEPVVRMNLILAVTRLSLEHDRMAEAAAWTAGMWAAQASPLTDRFAAAAASTIRPDADSLPPTDRPRR